VTCKARVIRNYLSGVGVNAHGTIYGWTFLVNVKDKSRARGAAVRVLEEVSVRGVVHEANRVRNALLKKWREATKESVERVRLEQEVVSRREREERERTERIASEIGRVAVHCDDQGHHLAVVLDPDGPECFALFITSRIGWAKGARVMTAEEAALCRVAHGSSHFVPVVRPRTQFTLRSSQLPAWRVAELLREFRREDAT
jgi:hypothetical protein